jgi:hypothetical protein
VWVLRTALAKMLVPNTLWHGGPRQARIDIVNVASELRSILSEFAGEVAEGDRSSRRREGCNKTLTTVARLHI